MNEITLFTDINQIELAVDYHKNTADQFIFEIGRRLSLVKENNLTHEEFSSWKKSWI